MGWIAPPDGIEVPKWWLTSGCDSKETAPAGELRPLIRTPDGGGVFQPGVLCARHRQAQESKLPAHESFRPNLKADQASQRDSLPRQTGLPGEV